MPLIEKKNWIDAFALATLLLIAIPARTKITQKLCMELLHSPTRGKKAHATLLHYKVVVDWQWPFPPDLTIADMVDETSKWDETAALICKNVRWNYQSTKSLLNYFGNSILKAAEEKRYLIEELIPIAIKEIKKDNFWETALSSENFVRKFDSLWKKFGSNIPKKPWQDLSSLKEIF